VPKIVWDMRDLYALAELLTNQGAALKRDVANRLPRELASLDAAQTELARYRIRLRNAQPLQHQARHAPSAEIVNELEHASRTVRGLHNLLEQIERDAEARAGRIWQHLTGAQELELRQRLTRLVGDPRTVMLGDLQGQLDKSYDLPSNERAAALRDWLQQRVSDAGTRLWLVMNSPDVALLLSENSDESDPAVKKFKDMVTNGPPRTWLDNWAKIPADQMLWFATAYPSEVNSIPGVPADMRGLANRIRLLGYRQKLLTNFEHSQQMQGFRLPARDATSIKLRVDAIERLLASPAGFRVLDFQETSFIEPMKVTIDGNASSANPFSVGNIVQYLNGLSENTKDSHERLAATLQSLAILRDNSTDPEIKRFSAELEAQLRGHQALKLADIERFADMQKPLAVLTAVVDAADQVMNEKRPMAEAVLRAGVAAGIDFGAGLAATAGCTSLTAETGVGLFACPVVGVAASLGAQQVWDKFSASTDYAMRPAPGDVNSRDKPIELTEEHYVQRVPDPMPEQRLRELARRVD
jgi:hypothetical protein